MLRIKSSLAGFSRVTVRESEQGFCVKAVRKPGGCNKTRPVRQSPQGVRLAGQNIRQVIHDLLPLKEDTKIFFSSFRGELAREYQIFKMLQEEGELSPAAFSLSGFNTPVALASIAFGLREGYSALYPVKNSFFSCIKAAQAALLSDPAEEVVLVYADEYIPPECGCFFRDCPDPAAFGIVLSRSPCGGVPLSSLNGGEDNPLAFLKRIILCGKLRVSSG